MIPTSIIAEGEALHPDMAHLLIAGTLDDRVNEVSTLQAQLTGIEGRASEK